MFGVLHTSPAERIHKARGDMWPVTLTTRHMNTCARHVTAGWTSHKEVRNIILKVQCFHQPSYSVQSAGLTITSHNCLGPLNQPSTGYNLQQPHLSNNIVTAAWRRQKCLSALLPLTEDLRRFHTLQLKQFWNSVWELINSVAHTNSKKKRRRDNYTSRCIEM